MPLIYADELNREKILSISAEANSGLSIML